MNIDEVLAWHRLQALGCNRAGRPWDANPHTQMADAIDAHLAKAGEPAQPVEAVGEAMLRAGALAHPRTTVEPLIVPQLPYGSEPKPYQDFSIMRPAIDDIVNRFLSWELPSDVCADPVACKPNCEWPRHGTNLLTQAQAKAMIEHVLTDSTKDGWFAGTEDADGNELVTLRADDPRLAKPQHGVISPPSYKVANALIDGGWIKGVEKDSIEWAELCLFIINISSESSDAMTAAPAPGKERG
jgi:hypothetical protein